MGSSKKYPFKQIGKRLKELKAEPKESYGFVENSVWYPTEQFLEQMHELVLKEYGGYSGYDTGIELFQTILAEIKASEGIYMKAAVLLRRLVTNPRIYADGNHRVAQVTVETFLDENRKKMWTDDSEEICMFIKHALEYNIEQVARWLEYGSKE